MNLPSLPPTPARTDVADPAAFQPIGFQLSDEHKLELLEHWRSIKKRKWPILSLAGVAAVVAAAVSLAMTPIYQATAMVQIESGPGKLVSIQDIYSAGAQVKEHYQTQVEILKSREVAERTVRALKLWEHPEYDPRVKGAGLLDGLKEALGMGTEPAKDEADLAAAATKRLMENVSIEPVRLSQLAKVNVESADPALAARLANALAENYILNDREARFKVSQQASGFLQDRLGDLRTALSKSEQALQDYRQSKGIVSLDGSAQTLAGQQVGGTNAQLVEARSRRLQLESAYQQVQAAPKGDFSGVPWVAREAGVALAQGRVNEVLQRQAQLSETQGAKSPLLLQVQAELESAKATLRSQQAAAADALTREYQAARATEQSLERALGAARSGVAEVNKEEFQLAVLEREVQSNRELYNMFVSRAKETDIAGEVQAAIARVVDTAVAPSKPVRPKKLQLVAVALVLSLLLASLVSVLLDKLDNTLKGGDDAELRLRLPMLTVLPSLQAHDHAAMAQLFIHEPNSAHAEAIRTARTGVLLSNIDQPHKSLLVTSTIPGEGKTTVSINLALAHAQTRRTLLIDADMRRPQVARRLDLAPGLKGLSNLVAGDATLQECLHTVADTTLLVMPVGDLPPNPLELLLSERFKAVLAQLTEQFEIVVIDSPPVELVSEALVLAPLATSTILVAKAMSTPTPMVRKSITRLQRAGAKMLGVVLNQLDMSKAGSYHSQYQADYGYNYAGAGYAAKDAAVDPGRS
ncbi:GumC family protein [Ideonella alba]|uniref:non-specific protein-tyrosine kinase n=1 Tax=Ideonella alba TaxID=2824118 RepID=A0A940Y5M0_9BURK|nr:polysaccharide biosynthesis tyrosine autokinase [Ideonella alba]MBQ0929173.1 polysaccharide biosynthesis tyrosine autokinase [Ideonella alba]